MGENQTRHVPEKMSSKLGFPRISSSFLTSFQEFHLHMRMFSVKKKFKILIFQKKHLQIKTFQEKHPQIVSFHVFCPQINGSPKKKGRKSFFLPRKRSSKRKRPRFLSSKFTLPKKFSSKWVSSKILVLNSLPSVIPVLKKLASKIFGFKIGVFQEFRPQNS